MQARKKQKAELAEKMKTTENGAVVFANEVVTLELTYNAVAEKQNEYQDYDNSTKSVITEEEKTVGQNFDFKG